MERSKKSKNVSYYAITPYFVNRQQQQNRLFFKNHLENNIRYKKVLRGNIFYSCITQSGERAYIFRTGIVSDVKAKKLKKKLRGASARI